MKKHLALIALIGLALVQARALEYGGIIDNDTTVRITGNQWTSPNLRDNLTVTANLRQPFNNQGTVYIAAEGFFRYGLGITFGQDPLLVTHGFTLDLSLLKIGASFKLNNNQSIVLNVGRFIASDETGLVLNQTIDGLWFQFNSSRAVFQAMAAYTGLLNAKTTSMLMASGSAWAPSDSQPLYILAAPYIIGNLKAEFPYLFANQTLTIEALALFGVGIAQTDGNRMYATLALTGPLAQKLFYTLSSTLCIHNFDFTTLSNLSRLEFSFYPLAEKMKLSFGATYASGTIPSVFTPFAAITAQPSVSLAGFRYTGILKGGLHFTFKPNKVLLLTANTDVLFDCRSDFAFNGVQLEGDLRYQMFSDVAFGLNIKSYFAMEEARNALSATLKATISF